MNAIERKQLEKLQEKMRPPQRQFNIVEILQMFPQSPSVHEIFKEVCIHYETPTLCYRQINMYIFGQLSRENHNSLKQGFRGERLRISDSQDNDFIKVCFLGYKASDKIKKIVVGENKSKKEEKVFAVCNDYLKEFCLETGEFIGNEIKIESKKIARAYYINGLFGIVTTCKNLFLQAEHSRTQKEGNRKKLQIYPNKIFSFSNYNEKVMFFCATSQQNWIIITEKTAFSIHVPIDEPVDNFQVTTKTLKLDKKIINGTKMSEGFVALCSEEKCIFILDSVSMKLTNRVYNDVQYSSLCFNEVSETLVASDFAGFLMAMSFHDRYGDLEEEGISFKGKFSQQNGEPEGVKKLTSKKKNNLLTDAPLNKEMRTPYTIVIKNSSRRVLEYLYSLEKSIITYESSQEKVIKFWDVSSLRVYKKIQLQQKINGLRACRSALFSLSEKGNLNYYKFEKLTLFHDQKNPMNLIDASLSSNCLYLYSGNMKQTCIHKLKLNHIPKITEYLRLVQAHNPRTFKLIFFKNQVYTFTTDSIHTHKLQVFGPFGLLQESYNKGFDEFHSMIPASKKRIIFWGVNKMAIKGKRRRGQGFAKYQQKTRVIYEKLPIQKEPNPEELIPATCSLLFDKKKIKKISYFDGSISIVCTDEKKEKKCYIIDEQLVSLSVMVNFVDSEIIFVQGSKFYLLFKIQYQYYLFDIARDKFIWKSQHITSWLIQDVRIIHIGKETVSVLSVYKTLKSSIQPDQPLYLVKLYEIKGEHIFDSKPFSENKTIYEHQDQHFSIEDIFHRSMPTRVLIKPYKEILFRNYTQQSIISKIFLPETIKNKTNSLSEEEIVGIWGKLLNYEVHEGGIFVLSMGTILSIYEISSEKFGQVIGVVDLDTEELIVQWNEEYKEEVHKKWTKTKKQVVNYLQQKDQISSPKLKRSLSKRSSRSDYEFPITLSPIKTTQKQKPKSPRIIDPVSINQLFYKRHIHEQIQREQSKSRKRKLRGAKSQTKINEKNIKKYNQIIHKTTIYSQSSSLSNFTQTLRFKTEEKDFEKKQKITNLDKIEEKKSTSKKKLKPARYETKALDQLQKSTFIEKALLPEIMNSRNNIIKTQKEIQKQAYLDKLKQKVKDLQKSRNMTIQ